MKKTVGAVPSGQAAVARVGATRMVRRNPWSKDARQRFGAIVDRGKDDLRMLSNRKRCYCHNWGSGLAAWYCLTGQRDALHAVLDDVEQDLDFHCRVRQRVPGEPAGFSRSGVRATYVAQAARLIAPADPRVGESSDFFARLFLQRPQMEPRGFLNPPEQFGRGLDLDKLTGGKGLAAAEKLGLQVDIAMQYLRARSRLSAGWRGRIQA